MTRAWRLYSAKMAWLPRRPPSSAEYQWNSMVLAALPSTISLDVSSTRIASSMVTVPLPSSSAPGAAKRAGKKRLMLS